MMIRVVSIANRRRMSITEAVITRVTVRCVVSCLLLVTVVIGVLLAVEVEMSLLSVGIPSFVVELLLLIAGVLLFFVGLLECGDPLLEEPITNSIVDVF